MSITVTHIRDFFTEARQASQARHRDIAENLKISEGELIAAHVGAFDPTIPSKLSAIRLLPSWSDIIESLEPVGEVMALTRNESCVHEKVGAYQNASHSPHAGLVLGGAIDLRLFYGQWAFGFAVTEETEKGIQRSLQFFDKSGEAVHKVFLKPQSHQLNYDSVVLRFTDTSQITGITTQAKSPVSAELLDADIDIKGFQRAWIGMRDTHEFFALLKQFKLTRTQALRLAPPDFSNPVDLGAVTELLIAAARDAVPIMVFVGNVGTIQIHSGIVNKVVTLGSWLNVLDAGFNLHLRHDHITSAWVVKKPTTDGIVTSLELFDAAGETIAMFFGERKPGKPELYGWRKLANDLIVENAPPKVETCVA